jgi:hypothetical protein
MSRRPRSRPDANPPSATQDDANWIPAEIVVAVDGVETTLETALQQARAAGAGAALEPRRGTKGAALTTRAFVRALAAYLDAGEALDESWSGETLAGEVEAFALRRALTDAHLIKPRNHAIRQLGGCALDGIRQTRQRDRK